MADNKPYPDDSPENLITMDLIVRFMVANHIAPNFLERPCTKALFSSLNPRYRSPTPQAFATKWLPNYAARLKEGVFEQLSSALAISLAIDMWTETPQPFLVVNAHVVTAAHKLDSFCIGFALMPESPSAANILQRIESSTAQMITCPDKIVAITTDTAGNVEKIGELCKWMWIPCVVHVPNLTVHDAVDKAFSSEPIQRARSLSHDFCNIQLLSTGL